MKAYLLKRLFQIIPTLLGITFITFLIIQLAPGNPATLKLQMATQGQMSDTAMSQQIIEETKKLYGLDKPLPIQYLLWVKRVFTLDFGTSYKDHRKVWDKIAERLPITITAEPDLHLPRLPDCHPVWDLFSNPFRFQTRSSADPSLLFPILASKLLGGGFAHHASGWRRFLGHFSGLRDFIHRC